MNFHRKQNVFLYYNLLLISYFPLPSDAQYQDQNSFEKRIRQTLTTICAEIEPSPSQEESYLMCNGARIPDFSQRSVPQLSSNNIPNIIHGLKVNDKKIFDANGQRNTDDRPRKKNHSQKQNRQIFANFCLPKYATTYLQRIRMMSDHSAYGMSSAFGVPNDLQFPLALKSLYNKLQYKNVNIKPGRNYPDNHAGIRDIPFINPSPPSPAFSFELSKSYTFDSKSSESKLNFIPDKYLDLSSSTSPVHLPELFNSINNSIESAVTKFIQEASATKFDTQNSDIQRKIPKELLQVDDTNVFKIPLLELTSNKLSYFQSSPASSSKDQLFAELHTSTYADDPVMQQFYNSMYNRPVVTTRTPELHTSTYADDPVMEQFYNSLYNRPVVATRTPDIFSEVANGAHQQLSNQIRHKESKLYLQRPPNACTSEKCARESKCNEFHNESKSVLVAPSNQYSKTCPPEPRLPLTCIIITIPCYNPMNSWPCNENFVNQNQYLSKPEIQECVGLPYPLGGLLGSPRTLKPASYVTHEIFQNTHPVLGSTQSGSMPLTSQESSMDTSNILSRLRYGVNVVSQLEEDPATLFQTYSSTQRPSEMVVSTSFKSIEVMRKSKEESTTLHLPQNEILTETMSTEVQREDDLQSQSQSHAVAEESTKKILTMIEKARQLQMRHRLD